MPSENRSNEKDDFWDIEKLLPKKKHSTLSSFATKPMTAEHTVAVPESAPQEEAVRYSEEEKKLSYRGMPEVSDNNSVTFYPENSLIKSITVRKYNEKYDFYDSFRRAAILYFDCPGEKCEFAQFFSYLPQYSQLTRAQKDYYFYWRSEMRHASFIKTDYSYVYLYVYEILNLPDLIPPKDGIKMLCRLWREYRAQLPRLDLYFSIWVQDYCMVHDLECPISEIKSFIFDIIRISGMKEYYFTDIGTNREGVWALLAYLSDYDWTRGLSAVLRQTDEDKTELYTSLLEGSFRVLLPDIWQSCLGERTAGKLIRISRQAFPNTLCTHMVKCKLDIEYYSLTEASGLRSDVTSAVRYIENKIRAVFGVKSRISVRPFNKQYRELIDCYFADMLRAAEKENKIKNTPAYERLYDAPSTDFSIEGADEIERASWDITARLCISEDEEPNSAYVTDIQNTAEKTDETEASEVPMAESSDTYGLGGTELEYIAHLLDGTVCEISRTDDDSIAERINEAFSDGFGDIILEKTDCGFAVIDDYREELTEWLRKITK